MPKRDDEPGGPKAPGGGGTGDDTNWGRFAGIGLQVAVGVALGYVVGSWLDRRYGWGSRGVLVGTIVGLAGGMYLLIKDAIRLNKD